MKEQEVGSVIERFCVAFLQKCSLNEELIHVYQELGIVNWVVEILQRAMRGESQHSFTLEFAAAMLENIINTETLRNYFSQDLEAFKTVKRIISFFFYI